LLGPDKNGDWYALQNNAGKSFTNKNKIISGAYRGWDGAGDHIRIMDYNGDAKEDIVLGPNSYGDWYALRNNGGTFTDAGKIIAGAYSVWSVIPNNVKILDINEDNVQDILLGPDKNGNWYALINHKTYFTDAKAVIQNLYSDWQFAGTRIQVIDYNNDGRKDIVLGPDANGNWYGLRNELQNGFSDSNTVMTKAYGTWDSAGTRIKVMDMNNDGKDDIVFDPDKNGYWYGLKQK